MTGRRMAAQAGTSGVAALGHGVFWRTFPQPGLPQLALTLEVSGPDVVGHLTR